MISFFSCSESSVQIKGHAILKMDDFFFLSYTYVGLIQTVLPEWETVMDLRPKKDLDKKTTNWI